MRQSNLVESALFVISTDRGVTRQDVGFVYLANHTIPQDVQKSLFLDAETFFSQSTAKKAEIESGPAHHFHGWFNPTRTSGGARSADQKETFDVGNDADSSRPNQWPANLPDMRTRMTFTFEECHKIHLELLSALAEQVGLPADHFNSYVDAKDHFFRVLHYPQTSSETFKERFRASPHTDYGILTLLINDDKGGLQVKSNVTGEYIDAPPIPGACIVNVGDLLARWFNDTLSSTEHRVVEPEAFGKAAGDVPSVIPSRYSIAWFGQANRDALIEPLGPCCTAKNPKKYEAIYAGEHVTNRLAKLHKDGKNDDWKHKDGAPKVATAVGNGVGAVRV